MSLSCLGLPACPPARLMTRSLLPLLLLLLMASTALAQTLTSVTVSPVTVAGGNADTGTVTLSGAAAAGGVSVTLSSNSTSAAVPATVLVPAGATVKTFVVTTTPVASAVTATLTATLTAGGTSRTAPLTVNPPAVSAVGFNPSSVVGGGSATGTVTLTGKALTGGLSVTLSSGSTSVTVPSGVTVLAGATSATFPVTTTAVAASASATITATGGGVTKSGSLSLTPTAVLYSLALSPSTLAGGNASVGTVTLNGPAPAGGATVALTNGNAAATVPANVPVPAGASSATFSITTSVVTASTAGAVTASYGGVSKSVTLTVTPAALSGVSLSPASVTGGSSSTGTVTLTGKAPAAGITVALGSNNTSATVPVNVVVAAGASTGTFSVTTTPVGASTTAMITATYGIAKTAVLTLNKPSLQSLSLSPASVTGGATSTGTVTLTGNAPTGGTTVALGSNSTSATVPVSVPVPAGSASATFTVSTVAVSSPVSATITATYGIAKTAVLAVTPLSLASVSLAPPSVTGGAPSTGTVTLSGAAPAGGVTVTLLSNNTSAMVPASVLVAAGSSTGTFQVTTLPVGATATVTITATYGAAQTATLTIVPPAVSGVSLSPTSVTGGSPSTGTVTLTGNAPAGGTTVSLLSGTPAVATVPASVVVTAGASTATFPVTTVSVTVATSVTITASYNGSQSAALTANPAASGPAYLSNLTVSPSAIIGGNSAFGTVTLSSPAPAGGVVVALKNNAGLTLPAGVAVPAGSTSQTFSISSSSVSYPALATISGSYGGWTQVATEAILPVGQSFNVQSLDADAGNASVVLSWAEMPDGSVRGYNVYRVTGNTTTLLNATPQQANFYADTGLVNGNSYQYEVSAIGPNGTESLLSQPVSAMPQSSLPMLIWINPPTSTVSGAITLYASDSFGSSGTSAGAMLLVDGQLAGMGGGIDAFGNAPSGSTLQSEFDTSSLTNGTHVFQIVEYLGSSLDATPPLTMQVSNQISGFSSDDFFQQDQGGLVNVTATVPNDIQQWTLQITSDSDGSVTRTWQGNQSSINLAWDGLNTAGNVAPDGNYTIQISAQFPSAPPPKFAPAGGGSVLAKKPVALVKGNPNVLVLISEISTNPAMDLRLASAIKSQLAIIQGNNRGLNCTVLPSKGGASRSERLLIRNWMTSTVTDFYLWGHGSQVQPNANLTVVGAEWMGGINFWSQILPGRLGSLYSKNPELHFIVPNMIHRQYNFVMMDTCQSAGTGTPAYTGSEIYDPGTPDLTSWPNAFQLGTNQNFSDCFYGWDGSAGFNSFKDGTLSNWEIWRELFWKHLAAGGTVYQSATWASQNYVGADFSINPWDQINGIYRAQEVDDTYLP